MDNIRSILDNLRRRAEIIRDETNDSANTAERVGQLLVDIIEGSYFEIIKTDDHTEPTDLNVYSSKRSDKEFGGKLSRIESDSAEGHITFKKGVTVEDCLVVRYSGQSELVETGGDIITEEDDAIIEVGGGEVSSSLSFGGLTNVDANIDSAPIGSFPIKKAEGWTYAEPVVITGSIDMDNMLIPAFDQLRQRYVFIPISVLQGNKPLPGNAYFPYTFPFILG